MIIIFIVIVFTALWIAFSLGLSLTAFGPELLLVSILFILASLLGKTKNRSQRVQAVTVDGLIVGTILLLGLVLVFTNGLQRLTPNNPPSENPPKVTESFLQPIMGQPPFLDITRQLTRSVIGQDSPTFFLTCRLLNPTKDSCPVQEIVTLLRHRYGFRGADFWGEGTRGRGSSARAVLRAYLPPESGVSLETIQSLDISSLISLQRQLKVPMYNHSGRKCYRDRCPTLEEALSECSEEQIPGKLHCIPDLLSSLVLPVDGAMAHWTGQKCREGSIAACSSLRWVLHETGNRDELSYWNKFCLDADYINHCLPLPEDLTPGRK